MTEPSASASVNGSSRRSSTSRSGWRRILGGPRLVRAILDHPLNRRRRVAALVRLVRWQLGARLLGYPVVIPLTDRGKLIATRGLHGATGNLYCGLHEYPDMLFVAHLLRGGDLFVDVGANIGSYTVLAAAVIGGRAIAVEPVPATFARLRRNVAVNDTDERVRCFNVAVGSRSGRCLVTSGHDSMNHVLERDEADDDAVEVDMRRLDDLVPAAEATVLKIDVEGFEAEVVRGADRLLDEPNLLAIVIELTGYGARYGSTEDDVDRQLVERGFQRVTYDPERRALEPQAELEPVGNALYVRDLEEASERVRTAPGVPIFGEMR